MIPAEQSCIDWVPKDGRERKNSLLKLAETQHQHNRYLHFQHKVTAYQVQLMITAKLSKLQS